MLSRQFRRGRLALVVILVVAASVLSVPAAAGGAVPVQDDGVFDANETQGTIERVRYQLLGIAAVAGALLVGYIWHTDPQRRLRVATRRRDARERAAIEALDDEFMLPVDAEDGDGAEGDGDSDGAIPDPEVDVVTVGDDLGDGDGGAEPDVR